MTFPHCPNPECANFDAPKQKNWYWKHGKTVNKESETIDRFRCKECKITFSDRTFSIDYYSKKKVDYNELMMQLVSCSGINDIGRKMGISPNTVNNKLERLARSVLVIHSKLLEKLPMMENFVADGIESFSLSQFFPNHINILVGSLSEFIYFCGFAILRRKGCMTDKQKKERDRLESIAKANPKAIENSMKIIFESLIHLLNAKHVNRRILDTDEHRAYRRAIKNIQDFQQYLLHSVTPSTLPRTHKNPLFPVNYIDRQIRKDVSDHVRETVQFAKCPSAMMMRIVIYLHYHNCVIPRRVIEQRKGNMETHAEKAGISRKDLNAIIEQNFLRRGFLKKINLDISSQHTWLRKWRNPGIKISKVRGNAVV